MLRPFPPSTDPLDERSEAFGIFTIDLAPRSKTGVVRWTANAPFTMADLEGDKTRVEAAIAERFAGWEITWAARIAADPMEGR